MIFGFFNLLDPGKKSCECIVWPLTKNNGSEAIITVACVHGTEVNKCFCQEK